MFNGRKINNDFDNFIKERLVIKSDICWLVWIILIVLYLNNWYIINNFVDC